MIVEPRSVEVRIPEPHYLGVRVKTLPSWQTPSFEGNVMASWYSPYRDHPRYLVENDDGVEMIFNADQIYGASQFKDTTG
jgi:hypothetical protein